MARSSLALKRKRPLTTKQATYVDDITEWALNLLSTFKFKSDITNYFLKKARADWQQVEYDLRESPVPAFGVIARAYEVSPTGPLVAQHLSPEEASEYFGEFPLEAAAINYIFTY
jgi:hypothetical protein